MSGMVVNNSISQVQQGQKPVVQQPDYAKYQVGATVYEPKGYLVETPIWKTPALIVKDTFQSIKSIGKGIKGEGNDHSLGHMNDFTMKAGGLAIASYLATTRVLPVKKGMEFVGFGAFIASMGLSKMLFTAPIKARYGFNINQEYVDSQGRQKPFYLDPQYRTWDLMPSENINKVGDKMGVNPNMENREEFIKDKMSKICIQANTMSALTAGITTPILGALISSVAEKALGKGQEARQTNNVNKKMLQLISNINDANSTEKVDQKHFEVLQGILKENKDKVVGNQFVDKVVKLIAKDEDVKLEECLRKDLNVALTSNKVSDMSAFLGEIKLEIADKKDPKKVISHTFSQENIKKALTEGENLNDNVVLNKDKQTSIINKLSELYSDEIGSSDKYTKEQRVQFNKAFEETLDKKVKNPPKVLSDDAAQKIRDAYKAFDGFKSKSDVLNEYIGHRIGKKEDSVMARQWKATTEGIVSALNFSDSELNQARKSTEKAKEILENKFVNAASSNEKYKETLGKVAKLIGNFDEAMNKGVSQTAPAKEGEKAVARTFTEEVTYATEKIYGDFADKARNSSLDNVADYIKGNNAKRNPHSAAKNVVASVENSIIGAKSSLYKVVQGLDVYKNIQDKKYSNESKEVVDLMKFSLMKGDISLHSVKFDIPQEETYKAVMNNIFYRSESDLEGFKLPNNASDAEKATKFAEYDATVLTKMDNHINKSTKEVLSKEFLADYKQQIKETADQLATNKYAFAQNNRIGLEGAAEKGSLRKQMILGDTLTSVIQKTADQKYNTKHWLKMVGAAGAGVAAIAVGSTFFFGKMKEPKQKVKKEVSING